MAVVVADRELARLRASVSPAPRAFKWGYELVWALLLLVAAALMSLYLVLAQPRHFPQQLKNTEPPTEIEAALKGRSPSPSR